MDGMWNEARPPLDTWNYCSSGTGTGNVGCVIHCDIVCCFRGSLDIVSRFTLAAATAGPVTTVCCFSFSAVHRKPHTLPLPHYVSCELTLRHVTSYSSALPQQSVQRVLSLWNIPLAWGTYGILVRWVGLHGTSSPIYTTERHIVNGVRTDVLLSERTQTASADRFIISLYSVLFCIVLIKSESIRVSH
jgi:hypothetical protein